MWPELPCFAAPTLESPVQRGDRFLDVTLAATLLLRFFEAGNDRAEVALDGGGVLRERLAHPDFGRIDSRLDHLLRGRRGLDALFHLLDAVRKRVQLLFDHLLKTNRFVAHGRDLHRHRLDAAREHRHLACGVR